MRRDAQNLSDLLGPDARVPTRHFVLTPISAPEHAPTTAQPLVVEVGFVKMPSYLLRDSMVVRKSAEEVEYLETALWAERLDQSFRHTLAENLSLLFTAAGADKPMAIGQTHLIRPGPSPRGDPQVISTTLSALLAESSRDLVQALRDFAEAKQ